MTQENVDAIREFDSELADVGRTEAIETEMQPILFDGLFESP